MVVVVIILLAYRFGSDIYCDSITVSGVNLGLDRPPKNGGTNEQNNRLDDVIGGFCWISDGRRDHT